MDSSKDAKILEQVNPVFNTAKMTLFQLASTGDPEAIIIAKKLGLTFEETQNSARSRSTTELMKANSIMLETRYKSMEAMALASGCRTIVDLPCGYTPRAKIIAEAGLDYFGLDLPAAIDEISPAVMPLIPKAFQDKVHFVGVDATNLGSLESALSSAHGPICILTEGLLMYFSDSEAEAMVDNIRALLSKFGGCWLTSDPESAMQYIMTIRPIVGDAYLDVMRESKARSEDKSDVAVGNNPLIVNFREAATAGTQKAMAFLAAHGLKGERIFISNYAKDIKSLSKLPRKIAKEIRENMSRFAYWKITLLEERPKKEKASQMGQFELSHALHGSALSMRVKGRLDSLSASSFLSLFLALSEQSKIESVTIDCKELDYLSSAGFRVLLIMRKECEKGVKLTRVQPSVNSLIEQMGFGAVLEIEE